MTHPRAGILSLPGLKEEWWRDAESLAARLEGAPAPPCRDWYRIGDGHLGIGSDDAAFRERLGVLFRECAEGPPPGDGHPRVSCTVRLPVGAEVALVSFEDPEPLDQIRFTLELFPDRGYHEHLPAPPGWRVFALPTPGGVGHSAVSGPRMLVHRGTPWQALVGSVAVNRLFRLQRGLVFFHAGSVGLRDGGILLVGPKGAGKTTLSLALAARGRAFLGDEIAGVRIGTREVVPMRRSVAVRDGPRAEAVSAALDGVAAPYEPFPDGTRRRRAHADQLFSVARANAQPLRDIVFLRGFGPEPRLETVRPGREHLGLLTPLGASLWDVAPVTRVRDLLGLVTAVRCSLLWVGPPEETADLLIHSLEG